jgi:hypothetical protein
MRDPSFLLAELFAESSLSRVARSALPDAPVDASARRSGRVRRLSLALGGRAGRPASGHRP